ncbi:hypothetical protein ASD23_09665 [Agromyces sp. Root1464]|nr:hypothetical protein ASD23_09665 [Agromyces sp. Root1464]
MVHMTRDSDDDALRWEGDDDPTLAPGWKTVGSPTSAAPRPDAAAEAHGGADARGAVEELGDESAVDEPEGADAAAQTGSAELVVLGVLGGIYLLYAIGWLITALGEAQIFADPVAQFMYGLGSWFAVIAAPLWFGTVLWLASGNRRARLVWLIVGAVLLVPIPFILRG